MKIVKIILLSALYGLVSSSPSSATYYKWSVDIEPDPLGKGEKVTARYSINADAGVSISCQTTEMGIAIDVTSGWKADVSILEIQPKPRLAIDGKELNAEPIKAITGLSENSIAGISANYDSVTSRKIVNAWMNAIYQIAIEDTISAEPLFMNASGSTSAGKKLHDCLEEQEVFSNASHKKRNSPNKYYAKQ